jgi:hypothetical protein
MIERDPTDEELVANPELALRGMTDEDFAKIGSLSLFLLDVVAAAREHLSAKVLDETPVKDPSRHPPE